MGFTKYFVHVICTLAIKPVNQINCYLDFLASEIWKPLMIVAIHECDKLLVAKFSDFREFDIFWFDTS